MRNNSTDITVVLDRSGSMQSCKADAEVGLNAFIRQQAAQPGEAIFSLVQFDDAYEVVHSGVKLKNKIPECFIAPRNGTALLDAIGRAIIENDGRLISVPENDRPGLVVFVIITDGAENSSRVFTKATVKTMIEYYQSVHKWQFTYIGANQDAFAEAGGIGIDPSSSLDFDGEKTTVAIDAASNNVCRMRDTFASGMTVNNSYTVDERNGLVGCKSLNRRIRLQGLNGNVIGKVWESNTILRAGRLGSLEIVLDEESVSRRHAEVRSAGDAWIVRDLGSTNGTFLNGKRLSRGEWPLVQEHDILRCGNVTLSVNFL